MDVRTITYNPRDDAYQGLIAAIGNAFASDAEVSGAAHRDIVRGVLASLKEQGLCELVADSVLPEPVHKSSDPNYMLIYKIGGLLLNVTCRNDTSRHVLVPQKGALLPRVMLREKAGAQRAQPPTKIDVVLLFGTT